MRDALLEVMQLQREYSHLNTRAMQRRGELIRRALPGELTIASGRLRAALAEHGHDLRFEGRDGTGKKTLIPWVRFFSLARSPSAQNGWYCVYLFAADGSGVYLALAHGSTSLEDGQFKPRPPEELARLVAWARGILAPIIAKDRGLSLPMDLRGKVLGDAYERSTVIAKWYAASGMPNDDALRDDAVTFAGYLKPIYDAEAFGTVPMSVPPEVLEVEDVASGGRKRHHGGQGFGLSVADRLAVEMHAMRLARAHLEGLGWRVKDVSRGKPYDLHCTKRGGEELIVEVKGTTSRGEQIVLTRNEVTLHQARHPNNALVVVHSISLARHSGETTTEGGTLMVLAPWTVEPEALRPIAYQYAVPLV